MLRFQSMRTIRRMVPKNCSSNTRTAFQTAARQRSHQLTLARNTSLARKGRGSKTSPMPAMLASSKPHPSNNSIGLSLLKPTYCTNQWMLRPSSSMTGTSFQGTQPMRWDNFTTLGQQEKHRKRRGGITEFRQRKLRFGRPLTAFAPILLNRFKKEPDLLESIRVPMKLIAIRPLSARSFEA